MTAVNPVVPAAQCLRMSTEHQQSVLRNNNSVNTPPPARGRTRCEGKRWAEACGGELSFGTCGCLPLGERVFHFMQEF
jgi:hypothetical protein